jgi:hypothetical protein
MPAESPAELEEALGAALSSGDIDAAVELYEAEGIFVPPGQPATQPARGTGPCGR